MNQAEDPILHLIRELERLPGIGRKSAQRLAFHILRRPAAEIRSLAESLAAVKEKIKTCSTCFNYALYDPCGVCRDPKRDRSVMCVVEQASEIQIMENATHFRGLYHVLGGALSPLDGVGPDDIHIEELLKRIGPEVKEIILATNSNDQGNTTMLYIAEQLKRFPVKVTRLARGMPVGSLLEYSDEITILNALQSRVNME